MRGNMQKAPALKGRSFLAAGATFTQSRYIANARVIIPNFRRLSSGIGKFSSIFFYFFPQQSMEMLCPVRRKYKTPSRTGFPSSRVSAAA